MIVLSCSGRDNRTMRTGPSALDAGRRRGGRIHSESFGQPVGEAEDARRDDVLLDLRGAAHDALRPAVEVDLERGVVGVDDRVRSRDRERGRAHRLLDPRHQQLVDGAAGTVFDAVEPFGQPPAHVEAQHLGLHVGPRNRVALVAAKRGRDRRCTSCSSSFTVLAYRGDVAELAGLALVAHDRHRHAPTFAGLADHVRGRNSGVVEQHLAELGRDPADHPQRPLHDPGLVHRDRERRQALVLRHVGISAREQEAPVGDVGVAGPDLVTVDHELVAVAHRGRAQRREVGAGVGLAEALAPPVASADQAGQEAILDRLAAVPC